MSSEDLRDLFPGGAAEFEDAMIHGAGADPQAVYAVSSRVWGNTPSAAETNWFGVVVGLAMVFLCVILTIGGL